MIKSVNQAREVCARRAAAEKKKLPRAVKRWLRKQESYDRSQSVYVNANKYNLSY